MKPKLGIVHHHTRDEAASCPSCGASASGRFCARCGETVNVHSASAAEFIHEFIGHYVALEGKLWATLRLLVFSPGQLTVDFLRGRRIPYINPLRLYLTLSLVMFALIKIVGVELPRVFLDERSLGFSYKHDFPDPARPGKTMTGTLYVQATESSGEQGVRDTVRRLGSANPDWTKNAERFMRAPLEEQAALLNHGFMANLPYMLIGTLPLFALYLKLIHWRSGRHYGDHLVFALHASAFAFLLAIGMMLIPGNLGWLLLTLHEGKSAMISPWDWVQLLPVLWILAYLPAALHRVYGGSRTAAWGKALVLLSVHLLVILGLVAGAEIIAILRHA